MKQYKKGDLLTLDWTLDSRPQWSTPLYIFLGKTKNPSYGKLYNIERKQIEVDHLSFYVKINKEILSA